MFIDRPPHKEINRKIKQAKENEKGWSGLPERAWENGAEESKTENDFPWMNPSFSLTTSKFIRVISHKYRVLRRCKEG
jgi:hypothetical protein